MIADPTLRWVVTLLFVLGAAECLYGLIVGIRRPVTVTSQLLHVVMAAAMAVMAWPSGVALPTVAPMVFFLAATVWFVAVTAGPAGAGHRVAGSYHALMMLAMAWMYAVMNGRLLPGQSTHAPGAAAGGSAAGSAGHAGHATGIPKLDMPGMEMPGVDTSPGATVVTEPVYITILNWVCTVGFAFAAVYWLVRYLALRMDAEPADAGQPLWSLCQSMMAAGMAIMFGVML